MHRVCQACECERGDYGDHRFCKECAKDRDRACRIAYARGHRQPRASECRGCGCQMSRHPNAVWCKPCSAKARRERKRAAGTSEPGRARARAWLRRRMSGQSTASGESPVKPCEICGSVERLRWDHDHQTGSFRGWLCNPCNRGLGHFRDNPDALLAAAEYLRKSCR